MDVYYFYSYQEFKVGIQKYVMRSEVSDNIHPFELLAEMRRNGKDVTLLYFTTIDEMWYNYYNEKCVRLSESACSSESERS